MSNEAIDKNAANYRSLAAKAKSAGADCMVSPASPPTTRSQVFKDFAAALPDAKLYGPDGVADTGFAEPEGGRHPGRGRARTKVTIATLSPDEYPPEGQEFFKSYTQKYGEENPTRTRSTATR